MAIMIRRAHFRLLPLHQDEIACVDRPVSFQVIKSIHDYLMSITNRLGLPKCTEVGTLNSPVCIIMPQNLLWLGRLFPRRRLPDVLGYMLVAEA